jgi:hypothetical protein
MAMRVAPVRMTFFGPTVSHKRPITGPLSPYTMRYNEYAKAVVALLHGNASRSVAKKTLKVEATKPGPINALIRHPPTTNHPRT